MIAELRPYPAMKDSDVQWLGEVPEHWNVRRGKWLFRHRKQINADRANSNVLSLTLRGVVNNDPDNPEGLVPKDYATYQLFRKGDLVFKLIDLENIRTSRVGLVHEDGIMSSAYVRLTPQIAGNIRFFFQHYFDLYQRGIYNQLGAGVRSTLGPNDLLNLSIVVPPVPEQAAIARFLDHADRRIRRYIRAKQKLIKLLEEQKQAIVHRAVTGGLDQNVRLKPSGVEWLGEVPEHWDVTQIRAIARVVRGGSPRPAGSPIYFHGAGKPWITVGEVTKASGMHLVATSTRLTPAGAERSRTIEAGTLLLTNSGATLGIPKISLIQGCINDGVAAFLNLRPRVNKEFLYIYLFSQTAHLKAWVDLGAQPNLNTQIIGGWPVPLPPTDEQAEIVLHVMHETALLVATIERAQREISLLREYRTRLIADVVTGKLDVRAAAASLPDEADEPEASDDSEVLADGDADTTDGDFDAAPEETEA